MQSPHVGHAEDCAYVTLSESLVLQVVRVPND
jgi:hypothetical protein